VLIEDVAKLYGEGAVGAPIFIRTSLSVFL
jgi:hypothetical protein